MPLASFSKWNYGRERARVISGRDVDGHRRISEGESLTVLHYHVFPGFHLLRNIRGLRDEIPLILRRHDPRMVTLLEKPGATIICYISVMQDDVFDARRVETHFPKSFRNRF